MRLRENGVSGEAFWHNNASLETRREGERDRAPAQNIGNSPAPFAAEVNIKKGRIQNVFFGLTQGPIDRADRASNDCTGPFEIILYFHCD